MHTSNITKTPPDLLKGINLPMHFQRTTSFSSIQDVCELLGFYYSPEQNTDRASMRFYHRRFKAGECVYRSGQTFESLYIVQLGFLKVVLRNSEGDERVVSFPMKGNMLGFDGIYNNLYNTESIALTDCELVAIPFKKLLDMAHFNKRLEHIIYMSISRELVEEHTGISPSSPLKSAERVAYFLGDTAKRYSARGYSSREILLPMTRRDIGCHLGLTLETVSRALSALSTAGVIAVHRKNIQILKPESLHLFQTNSAAPPQQRRSDAALAFI